MRPRCDGHACQSNGLPGERATITIDLGMRRFIKRLGALRAENPITVTSGLLLDQLLRRSRPTRLRIAGHPLVIRSSSPDLGVALSCLGGEFRSLGDAWPRDTPGLIVDAGGNIGTAAIALAGLFPQATVVSVEPSEENFAILTHNVAGNPRIHAERAALVADESIREITLRDRGSSVGFTVVADPRGARPDSGVTVPATGLRTLLAKHGHERIMILKMDIEGAELGFFEDPSWLDLVDVLMIELHDKITPGCTEGFRRAAAGRFIYRTVGQQYVSVGRGYLERKAGLPSPRP